MEPIYSQEFQITDNTVDCYGRLKASMILYFVQEVAGQHFSRISMDYESLAKLGMFWAITRQKVQITRMPCRGETIRLETWPMPTTRVAYPRSVVAYDEAGNECFRSISIWVLMDVNTRNMILPGKSGISVPGTLRGMELAAPGSLMPKELHSCRQRTVSFTDLDRNGHMNNTVYADICVDTMFEHLGAFNPTFFEINYNHECRVGDRLNVTLFKGEDNTFFVSGDFSDNTNSFKAKVKM